MLVNEADKPLLTLVVAAGHDDDSLRRRFESAFAVFLPGLDIVFLNNSRTPNSHWQEKCRDYSNIYPNVRYAETQAKSELELFCSAASLCRGKYFHLSRPGIYINPSFFKLSVAHMEEESKCNLVSSTPVTSGDKKAITFSSISTKHYTRASRIALNMYLSIQNNFQLDGVIRASDLQLSSLKLNDNTWRASIIVDLACRGTSHDLMQCQVEVDSEQIRNELTPVDHALLNNQINSICRSVDSPRDKCLLVLSALANAAQSVANKRKFS